MVNPDLWFANSTLRITLTIFILLITSCTQVAPTTTLEPIRVQYSFATQPWLANLANCAGQNVTMSELRAAGFQDPQSTDLDMRIGNPGNLTNPGYQIGADDLLVIVNPKKPVNELTADQVRGIFTGRIQTWEAINHTATPIQVWVFPNGEDVQQVFEQTILGGSPVTSLARFANSPGEMLKAVANDPNSIGIITRHLKTSDTTDVFTAVRSMPVLAITESEPQGALAQILACLQK